MKSILVSLFLLVMLSACKQQKLLPQFQTQTQESLSFESLLSGNTTFPPPKIIVSIGTGVRLYPSNQIASGEYDYTLDPELPNRKISKVRGYTYTHIYQDLGLKITTASLYEPYFYQFSSGIILKRIGNIIYLSGTFVRTPDYIEAFSKDSRVSLRDEVQKQHMLSGCRVESTIGNTTPGSLSFLKGLPIVYLSPNDGIPLPFSCDKEFPQNILDISFFQNPKHPNTYYKITHGSCAPGPCSIFGKIEFF